jgi:uncharacterized protein YdeI (YjbR/CyaY-like superfamily)
MTNYRDIHYFKNRKAWRSWLDDHSSDGSEAWLVIQKKHSALPGLSLDDAVEEALCYGWIDGTLNTRDDQTYLLRFSPRRPNSVWSMSNIRRVEKLQRSGSMTEAGYAAVEKAKEGGQWQAAIDRENLDIIPSDLKSALRGTEGATAAYRNLPDSKKKHLIYWLQSAKRKETRQKRIAKIVEMVLSDQ